MSFIQNDLGGSRRQREAYIENERFAGIKLLVAGRSADAAIMALRKFRALGMEVFWAKDAGAAEYFMGREKFDLILIDCDGDRAELEAACFSIGKAAAAAGVSVVAHSGRDFLQLQEIARSSGLRGVLPKHASLDVVKEMLLPWVKIRG